MYSGSTDTEEVALPGLPVMPHTWVLELEYSLKHVIYYSGHKYVFYSGHKYVLYIGHKYVLLWWSQIRAVMVAGDTMSRNRILIESFTTYLVKL